MAGAAHMLDKKASQSCAKTRLHPYFLLKRVLPGGLGVTVKTPAQLLTQAMTDIGKGLLSRRGRHATSVLSCTVLSIFASQLFSTCAVEQ